MLSRILNRLLFVCFTAIITTGLIFFINNVHANIDMSSNAVASVVTQEAVQSTLLPRFISIDPYGVHPYGLLGATPPTIQEVKGIRLSNSEVGQPAFAFGFTLPPDYAEGTDFNIRFVWRSDSVTCGFKLSSFAWIGSVGAGGWSTPNTSIPNLGVLIAPNSSTNEAIILTVAGVSASNQKFKAGDPVTILTDRESQDTNDTCTGEIEIFGISVIYSGLSNYLPFIAR